MRCKLWYDKASIQKNLNPATSCIWNTPVYLKSDIRYVIVCIHGKYSEQAVETYTAGHNYVLPTFYNGVWYYVFYKQEFIAESYEIILHGGELISWSSLLNNAIYLYASVDLRPSSTFLE